MPHPPAPDSVLVSPERVAVPPGPFAARIILGSRLRQIRESGGISVRQAAAAIGGSSAKISRIELGRHPARETDVVDLLNCYNVTARAQRDELLELASAATAPRWWQRFTDLVPPSFLTYLALEEAAESIQCYDDCFMPGLLQSGEYAACVAALRDPEPAFAADDTALRRLAELRAERVGRFTASGAQLMCVIDEAVLHRDLRSPKLRQDQLRHLRKAAERPNVTVRIRPLKAGPPTAPAGFSIMRFASPLLPDVGYAEQLTGPTCVDQPADVNHYRLRMRQLLDSSAPAERTAAIIDQMLASRG
jgi:transcriptional regulator with XRE-family HTH domain